jgi:hypothetical protein
LVKEACMARHMEEFEVVHYIFLNLHNLWHWSLKEVIFAKILYIELQEWSYIDMTRGLVLECIGFKWSGGSPTHGMSFLVSPHLEVVCHCQSIVGSFILLISNYIISIIFFCFVSVWLILTASHENKIKYYTKINILLCP